MPYSDKPQIIRKSNDLIEARYKLSLAEQRLVVLLASEITPDDEDFKDYEIRIADFAKMFDLEKCNAIYSEVEKAAEGLLNQRIVLQDDRTKEITNWLSYVKYVKGSGVVRLRFDKSLKPYLLQLKGHFTQYQANYVLDFKSQYSIRLYELLKMDAFKANKRGEFEKTFEVSELRFILGISKDDYPLFANFKQKAIQPAISEISDKTDLYINDVKYGKTGKKITDITFSVLVRSERDTKLRQANLRIEDIQPEKGENHPIIDSLVNLGFSLEVAKKYKNKYGVNRIKSNISYTLAKKQEGKVKDIPAFLNNAIENDYGSAWDIENQKKTEAKSKREKLDKEKQEKEEQAHKEVLEAYQKAYDNFISLPKERQEEIKNEFIEKINPFTGARIKKFQKNGDDFLNSKMILPEFKKYLIENVFREIQ